VIIFKYLIPFLLIPIALFGSSEELVKKLMELRSEVELLNSEIENEKDSYKSTIKSLSMQKSDLEAQINRKETQLKEIRQDVEKIKEEIEKHSSQNIDLKPLILDAIEKLRNHIKNSLPFKLRDRLKDLETIESQMRENLITPQKALAKIWSSYEDSIRLTKENALFKEVITLEDKSVLSEVAKIGMVMLFFKTPDERVGQIHKRGNEWIFEEERDEISKTQILNLFDALHKQIRTGYFTIPNSLVQEVKQ
jgi:DNA repair exonuclease SbcCD ATPase subunit